MSRPRCCRRLVGLLLLLGLAACGRSAGEPFQPTQTQALALEPGAEVGQTFRVPGRVVTRVDLLTATYAAPADPQGRLAVVLRPAPDGPVLARAEVPGTAVRDSAWTPVPFDRPVAVGDVAAIEVTWDGERPVALYANAPPQPLPDDHLLNDPYPGGELVRDGEPATGDLAFRVVGRRSPGAWAAQARALAAGLVQRLAERPLFAAAWTVLLLGCLGLGAYGFAGQRAAAAQLGQRRPDQQAAGHEEG